MLIISRLARVAEKAVEGANDFVKSDPDADAFFVELPPDETRELEALQGAHPELVTVSLGMSLSEWALAYPHVDRVQVRFGQRFIEVRVGQHRN